MNECGNKAILNETLKDSRLCCQWEIDISWTVLPFCKRESVNMSNAVFKAFGEDVRNNAATGKVRATKHSATRKKGRNELSTDAQSKIDLLAMTRRRATKCLCTNTLTTGTWLRT